MRVLGLRHFGVGSCNNISRAVTDHSPCSTCCSKTKTTSFEPAQWTGRTPEEPQSNLRPQTVLCLQLTRHGEWRAFVAAATRRTKPFWLTLTIDGRRKLRHPARRCFAGR